MKEFFNIKSDKYRFEIYDLTALFTVINVALIIMGVPFASYFGLANNLICIVMNIKNKTHINAYITQLALIILNIYFLI